MGWDAAENTSCLCIGKVLLFRAVCVCVCVCECECINVLASYVRKYASLTVGHCLGQLSYQNKGPQAGGSWTRDIYFLTGLGPESEKSSFWQG